MRNTAIGLGLCLALGVSSSCRADEPAPPGPPAVDLWPATPPGESGTVGAEKSETSGGILRISNVSKPTLTYYRPSPETDTGTAVVICPGGGYNILASDHEGAQVAKFLNTIGVTGVLLKYRVPRRAGTPNDAPPPQALMDAQRALSVVRSRAAELKIDPSRVGILGFSAGGHLAAWASTNPDKRAYEPVDEADKASCRPDFTVLIYPAYLVQKGKADLAPEIRFGPDSPPTFFAHAGDDPVTVESSIQGYLALKRAGVPAEMHVYATGGHGYGMNKIGKPVASWPDRVADWMKARGLLKPPARG